MYFSQGASVLGFSAEGEAVRQQMLDKQRAILEQKKKQRQMQHGMMVAGGGRPTSSKSHRLTSSRPSTGSSIQSTETSSVICPNLTKCIDFTYNVVPSTKSDSSSGDPSKIKTVNVLCTMEDDNDGHNNGSQDPYISPPHINKQQPISESKSSYKSKPSNSMDASASVLRSGETESVYGSQRKSAAVKLEALGIAPSLNYDIDSGSDEEFGGDTVLTNPGREEDGNCPLESAYANPDAALVTPQSGEVEMQKQDFEKLSVILSPGGNNIENLNAFVNSPAPDGMSMRCRVQREKRGMERSMFPTYYLYLDRGESARMLFLLAARKRKKSRSSNYLISTSANDLSRGGKNFVSKLRANFLGTSFTVYDNGVNPSSHFVLPDKSNLRQELAAILYETNVLGFKGPRKMTAIIPALNYDNQSIGVHPIHNSETLLERWKNNKMANLLLLHNKQPVWSDETQAFVLNFHGRVTQASVKNFQLVHTADEDYIILQFGRISDDLFTLDYRFPLTALQAFSISLSSFDSKLACE